MKKQNQIGRNDSGEYGMAQSPHPLVIPGQETCGIKFLATRPFDESDDSVCLIRPSLLLMWDLWIEHGWAEPEDVAIRRGDEIRIGKRDNNFSIGLHRDRGLDDQGRDQGIIYLNEKLSRAEARACLAGLLQNPGFECIAIETYRLADREAEIEAAKYTDLRPLLPNQARAIIPTRQNEEIYSVRFSCAARTSDAAADTIEQYEYFDIFVTRWGQHLLQGRTGRYRHDDSGEGRKVWETLKALDKKVTRDQAARFLAWFLAHPRFRCSEIFSRGA
jgi:hypothetical protein